MMVTHSSPATMAHCQNLNSTVEATTILSELWPLLSAETEVHGPSSHSGALKNNITSMPAVSTIWKTLMQENILAVGMPSILRPTSVIKEANTGPKPRQTIWYVK
jgi:hypothetical protein